MQRRESLREFLLRNRMCSNCGLADEHGGLDTTSLAVYWFCLRHLNQRLEAQRRPNQRVTLSAL